MDSINKNNCKRVEIVSQTPLQKLAPNEFGIKSGIKGAEISEIVERILYKLLDRNMRTITLKAIGNACNKVLSMADIIRRKIKDLNQINITYSRKYTAKYESDDVILLIK
jgi:DNA-binding protein